MQPLQNLCKTQDIFEKSGIYISKNIANTTVWDNLAVENPTHAVISATDEAAAASKSTDQINHLAKLVDESTVLLDYGCGYGRVAKYLLPRQPVAGYIGLDSSHAMLQLFRQRYDHTDVEQTTPLLLLNADINDSPLLDATVDVAIVAAVFLHNHKMVVQQSVRELTRVVKPGGTVVVYGSFPRLATAMGLQGQVYQMLLNLLGRPFKNGPVRYYTRREVARLFGNFARVELVPAGFSVIPKSLIFLPRFLDAFWRKGIANPLNFALERITPAAIRPYFAVHYDVIATR